MSRPSIAPYFDPNTSLTRRTLTPVERHTTDTARPASRREQLWSRWCWLRRLAAHTSDATSRAVLETRAELAIATIIRTDRAALQVAS